MWSEWQTICPLVSSISNDGELKAVLFNVFLPGHLNNEWSEYWTSKSLLFRCFHYSDVCYSDPHCIQMFTHLGYAYFIPVLLMLTSNVIKFALEEFQDFCFYQIMKSINFWKFSRFGIKRKRNCKRNKFIFSFKQMPITSEL